MRYSELTIGILASLAGCAMSQSGEWMRVSTPNFGIVSDMIVDIDGNNTGLYVLVSSKDNAIINGNTHYHVLRRDGSEWTDLEEPDVTSIEANSFGLEGVIWTSLAVSPDGEIWIGGEHEPLAQVNRGYQRPVFARWDADTGWSEPESVELLPVPQIAQPAGPRGGTVNDLSIAPDCTVIAAGIASGWGALVENNGSIPMLLRHDGNQWTELNIPDRDWPGTRGATFADEVVCFGFDDILTAGRHPGGNGVGSGALIVEYVAGSGPVVVSTPANGGQPDAMEAYGIDALSPDNVWVVGQGSVLADTSLLMHYDGSSWELYQSPTTVSMWLQTVVMNPDGTAWAFTSAQRDYQSGEVLLQAFYDGAAWSLADFVVPQTNDELIVVRSASRDHNGQLWAVGSQQASIGEQTRTYAAKFVPLLCPADTNNDGILSPADFSAWVAAFNAQATACDQNGDGACTPSDFSAWVANFNAGC